VATPIKGVQAQRLVRRLCGHCSVAAPAPSSPLVAEVADVARAVLGDVPPRWMQARGCPRCQHTGYLGRFGIYEMIPVDEAMQQAVVGGASHAELKAMAVAKGHRFLRTDGLLKAWEGLTSVDEILRVTSG
jgi:general secretion pathway protein E